MPMASALELITVPEPVSTALLRREGPLGMLLQLAQACESNDDGAFDQAAQALGLSSSQINGAHLQALAWADHIGAD
jgi:EAL and modified HD-GYP domain-containing signal transduction protein